MADDSTKPTADMAGKVPGSQQRQQERTTSIRFGPYELIEPPLGRGGMGVVYKARHSVLGPHACIKLLLPEHTSNRSIVERFVNEARAAAKLDHEHVCQVLDCAQTPEGAWYIVLEYLEGVSLAKWLRNKTDHGVESRMRLDDVVGSTNVAQIGRILLPVAGVLHAAHEVGIVHRDVKPDNIMLIARWQGGRAHSLHPKLLDFGIAKMRDEHGAGMTRTGTYLGTAAYMAPEQLGQAKLADRRTDVYALGNVLFRMVTGGYYAWGDAENRIVFEQLFHRMVTEPPPDPRARNPTVNPRLAELVRWALACDPVERCPSALVFGETLADIVATDDARHASADFLKTWIPAPTAGPLAATRIMQGDPGASPDNPGWRPPTSAVSLHAASAHVLAIRTAETVDLRPPPPEEEDDDAPASGSLITPPPVVRTPVYPMPPPAEPPPRGRARMVAGLAAGALATALVVVTLIVTMSGGGGARESAPAAAVSPTPPPIDAAVDAAPVDAGIDSTPVDGSPAIDAAPAPNAAPARNDKPRQRPRPGGGSSAIHDFAPPGR